MGGSSSKKFHPSRQITITNGRIIGRRLVNDDDKSVDAFQGIPFAKPPIGQLRFKKPEPPDSWEGIKECTKFGPKGIQKPMLMERFERNNCSEDNLYLNVFTPCWNPPEGTLFPVMLFIHGGGFVCDSSQKYGDESICKYLVTKDVVVVTVQYRLGFLGFWTTGDNACTDNLALWDMRQSLLWVNENIQAFNGDKDNVTLFGQSAGGASVDLLSLSPHTRDLFHKVIPMAGNASAPWAIHRNGEEACREFARSKMKIEETGTSEEFIKRLKEQPATKFATSMFEGDANSKEVNCQIAPRMDGQFFPSSLEELRKEAGVKPRMVGCCQYEGLFLILRDKKTNRERFELIVDGFISEDVPEFKKKRQEMVDLYLNEEKDKVKALAEIFSDIFLNIWCQKYVNEWLDVGQDQIFFYSYDYFNPKCYGLLSWLFPFLGASHCVDITYVVASPITWPFTFTEKDIQMIHKTTAGWTNFAKFGDPNGREGMEWHNPFGVHWDAATKENRQRHLCINEESLIKNEYHEGRPFKWLNVMKKE